jgi:hypothetical protein
MTWHPGVLAGSKPMCNSSFITSKAWATDSVMGSQPEGHLQTLWSFATCKTRRIDQKRHATSKTPETVEREQGLLPSSGDTGLFRTPVKFEERNVEYIGMG